jgi:hypothetical protein
MDSDIEADSQIEQRILIAVPPGDAAKCRSAVDGLIRTVRSRRAPSRTGPVDSETTPHSPQQESYKADRRPPMVREARFNPMAAPPSRMLTQGQQARALNDALEARDALVSRYEGNYDAPAAVVGAFNTRTGKVVTGESGTRRGVCAEGHAVQTLGCDPALVFFTGAIRPRTMAVVPVCVNCQGKYNRNQFERGTLFD